MSDKVVPLFAHHRPARAAGEDAPAFRLKAARGDWSLDSDELAFTPDQLTEVADILRDIARSLEGMARRDAGVDADACLGEFVLHDSGGIDYWISPAVRSAEDRGRLRIALRNAIASIRD